MNVELVAQMFKNYQSNVLFHLEGNYALAVNLGKHRPTDTPHDSYGQPQGAVLSMLVVISRLMMQIWRRDGVASTDDARLGMRLEQWMVNF